MSKRAERILIVSPISNLNSSSASNSQKAFACKEAGPDAVIAVLSEGQRGGVGGGPGGSSGGGVGSRSAKGVRDAARGGARNAVPTVHACHAHSRH